MTVAKLLNFGDGDRILHSIDQRPVKIGIGKSRTIDLDDAAIKFIRKAMPNDTLIIIEEPDSISASMQELMAILADVATSEYDPLLTRMAKLLGRANIEQVRPTRNDIRMKLRQVAFDVVHGKQGFAEAAGKRFIRDDQDPGELEQEQQEQRRQPAQLPPVKDRPPVVPTKDQMDRALGITVADEAADGEGEGDQRAPGDLGPAPPQGSAAAPPKQPRPQARPRAAAPSASRNKSRQTGSAAPASGKSGRVRA